MDLPVAGLAVHLSQSGKPNIAAANAVNFPPNLGTAADLVADGQVAKALAKRRAFIQALARQAARELAAQALAARGE